MKNKFLLLLLLSSSIGFTQDILWEKSFGGNHAEYLMDAKPTADFGFILAGSSLSNKSGNKTGDNLGDMDYWVWKMDENGDLDWQKSFGGSGSDFLQSIYLTRDGGFILAGLSNSPKGFDKNEDSRGEDDFWIIKLNAKGDQEWQKTIGGSGQEKLQTIIQTRDGGFIVGGSSSSPNPSKGGEQTQLKSSIYGEKTSDNFGNLDYWVVKIDAKGTIEWQKSYGGIYMDELRGIEQTVDGGYIVGGYSNSPSSPNPSKGGELTSGNKDEDIKGVGDYWVLKLDSKGFIQWQKVFGGSKDDQLYAIHQTYDKGFIIGGNSNSPILPNPSEGGASESGGNSSKSIDGTDMWVVKLNEEGKMIWQETYDFGKVDILTSLIENDDHSILIGGLAKGESSGSGKLGAGSGKAKEGTDDYIAIKINEKGEKLWDKSVGSDGEDILKKVIETRDGGYLFAGTSNPQARPIADGKKSSPLTPLQSRGGLTNGISGDNQQFSKAQNELTKNVTDKQKELTKDVNDQASKVTNSVKDELGIKDDSPLKLGGGDLLTSSGGSNGSNGKGFDALGAKGGANDKKLPASGTKKNNYGSNDFWVVKLRDKDKKKEDKPKIEAFPNPSLGFTNVIVGYDFESGTATVVDMGGRQLQQFEITSRTVPVDLSQYPEGIYIVNIKTNVQSDGIKVIKGLTKN